MEAFPADFNDSILRKTYVPDTSNKVWLQRQRIYDGVFAALKNGERQYQINIIPGITAIQIRELVIDLCLRFPERVKYEGFAYVGSWSSIPNLINPPIRNKYIIEFV